MDRYIDYNNLCAQDIQDLYHEIRELEADKQLTLANFPEPGINTVFTKDEFFKHPDLIKENSPELFEDENGNSCEPDYDETFNQVTLDFYVEGNSISIATSYDIHVSDYHFELFLDRIADGHIDLIDEKRPLSEVIKDAKEKQAINKKDKDAFEK